MRSRFARGPERETKPCESESRFVRGVETPQRDETKTQNKRSITVR